MFLCSRFQQLVLYKQILNAQVHREYNETFVYKRVPAFLLHADKVTSTGGMQTDPDWDAEEGEESSLADAEAALPRRSLLDTMLGASTSGIS